ncbi:MAG: carboxymuconolactone decarboxylase family protein [Actinomycetota bacterium]|nr:carboxymuconolactone decarboxylase family protein [Actinomycetota bacterium]MDQ2980725.1 carboxymuconolactone decarboxylase family protein [Actinomycetota bacterium]
MEHEHIAWVKTAEGARGLANILASHSLNPEALEAHVRLYRTIMFGDSPLTRTEREAIAVAVSAANDCHY